MAKIVIDIPDVLIEGWMPGIESYVRGVALYVKDYCAKIVRPYSVELRFDPASRRIVHVDWQTTKDGPVFTATVKSFVDTDALFEAINEERKKKFNKDGIL